MLLGASSILAMSLLAQPVLAQPVSSMVEDDAGAGQEIIVTAQRREQRLMSVPLSIQATTGEQLANSGIHDLTSLQFSTPGYLPATNSGFTQIFIRGIGNSIQTGADPSVATFVDDVPRIYGSMADNLVDVERVEILKGAQGGLYGRNSTGGVVNVITRKPSTDEVKGNIRASYGQKRTFRLAAYINLPISEKIALSISGERDSHGPYVKNIARANPYSAANFPSGSPARFGTTPQATADFFNAFVKPDKLNTQDFWAFNSKLLLRPTENLSITLAGDWYRKDDTNGQGAVNITPNVTQAVIVGLFRGQGITAVLPPGFITAVTKKFTAAQGAPIDVYIREYGVSGTILWNAPGVDLSSISAYRNQRRLFLGGAASVNVVDVAPLSINPYRRYFYQEFRAVSTFDGPLSLLGGATYLNNHVKGSSRTFALSNIIPLSTTANEQRVKNYSIYGEIGYDVTDALNVKVSGRYMREKNRVQFTLPVLSASRSVQSKFVPSATISYKLDGGSVYLRWARGYKTGGVNVSTAPFYFPKPTDGSIFGPETVDSYEAGYKQSLFDRKVQVTAAAFYNDYKNLQTSIRGTSAFPQITTAYINAKSARTYGVEGSLNWRIVRALTVGVNAGYLNARYKDFKLSGSTVLASFDRSGTVMPKAPKWQLSFTANLDQPVSDSLNLVGSLLIAHTSKVLYAQSANPLTLPDATGPAYWLANMRMGVKTADEKYGFAVVADNIFNTIYYVNSSSTGSGNTRLPGNPRIIRGEFTVKF
jgi:iron complex outermembrane recepter protein